MLKTRVTDGVRTRDNRNHNPPSKPDNQRVRSFLWAWAGAENPSKDSVGVPGPETASRAASLTHESEVDVFDALRRTVCP